MQGASRGARRKTVGTGGLTGSAQTQGASQAWQPTPHGTTWPPCGLRTPAAPLVIDVSDITSDSQGLGDHRTTMYDFMPSLFPVCMYKSSNGGLTS